MVSAEQAAQLRSEMQAHEASAPQAGQQAQSSLPPPTTDSKSQLSLMVLEALGYLGGAIVVVALALLGSFVWPELTRVGQLAVIAAIFLLLLGAGFGVPQRLGSPARRLRAVIWAAATVAWAVLVGFGVETYTGLHNEQVVAVAAWSSVVLALLLWFLHHAALQQIAVFSALLVGVGVGTYLLQGGEPGQDDAVWQGVTIGVVSLVWFGFGWLNRIRPSELAMAIGTVGALFAVMIGADSAVVAVAGLALLAGLVALSVWRRDFVLLIIAAVGAFQLLPRVVMTFFPGVLAAALLLLVVGLLLIAAALLIARRRHAADGLH